MLFVSHIPTRNNHHCSSDYFDIFLWIKAQKRRPNLQQSSTNILRGTSSAKTAHSARERDTWSSLCFTLSPARLSLVIKLSIYPTPSQSPFQFLPLWTWQVIRMDYRESREFLRIILHRQNTLTSRLVFLFFFFYYTHSAMVSRGMAVWLPKFVLIKALWRHDLSIFGSEAAVSLRPPLLCLIAVKMSVWLHKLWLGCCGSVKVSVSAEQCNRTIYLALNKCYHWPFLLLVLSPRGNNQVDIVCVLERKRERERDREWEKLNEQCYTLF